MRFHATLLPAGKTATGIEVPVAVVEDLGPGKKPAVRITINGHTYRCMVVTMGRKFMVGVSAENRERAGIAGGDELDADIELDTAPPRGNNTARLCRSA